MSDEKARTIGEDVNAIARRVVREFAGFPDMANGQTSLVSLIADALTRERAATWTAAAAVHQQFCVSIACRTNKVMCSEYETYRNRSEGR